MSFSQLPQELRDAIWLLAAAAQYHHIAEGLPKSPTSPPFAERQRQAIIGHHSLPRYTERQPLRIYVHDSHSRNRIRVGVDEVQTLANRLPLATVCSEARAHATAFCRTQVRFVNLLYAIDGPDIGRPDEPSVGRNTIAIPESRLGQPTTVMVTTAARKEDGPPRFDSAEHLVDVIDRVFRGSHVETIVFNSWFEARNSLERVYWPHTAQTLQHEHSDPVFTPTRITQIFSQSSLFMRERAMHVRKSLYRRKKIEVNQLFGHLLKFQEVFDAATQKLPRLQSIELGLHIYCWDDVLLTRIKTIKRNDDALCVDWKDVNIGYNHQFVGPD